MYFDFDPGGGFFKFAVKKSFKTRPNSPYGGETSSNSLLQQGVKYYTNFKIQSSSYADWYLPRPVFKRSQWQTITDAFAQFPGKFTKNSLWGMISRPLLPVLQFRKAIIKK